MKKAIVSYCLFLIYSISFAHDLIPHTHTHDVIEHTSNHHELHQHVRDNLNTSDSVSHGNHLDLSLYDYLVCLMGELAHHDPGLLSIHFPPEIVGENKVKTTYQFNQNRIVSVFNEYAFPFFGEEKVYFTPFNELAHGTILPESLSYRGPPASISTI